MFYFTENAGYSGGRRFFLKEGENEEAHKLLKEVSICKGHYVRRESYCAKEIYLGYEIASPEGEKWTNFLVNKVKDALLKSLNMKECSWRDL